MKTMIAFCGLKGQSYFIPVAWGVACIALFAAIQEGHYIRSRRINKQRYIDDK